MRLPRALLAFVLSACGTALAQLPPAHVTRTFDADFGGQAIAVDPVSAEVYVADATRNRVSVTSQLGAVTVFPTGKSPRFLAVDHANSRAYVSNEGDATLTVRTPTEVRSLPIGGSGPIVVDEAANKAYVLRQGNNGEVAVVDGNTLSFSAIDTGSHTPFGIAINAAARRLFVSHTQSGDVRSIDLTSPSDHPPTISVQVAGHPGPIAYNAANNKVYVLSDDARGPIVEIDAATHIPRAITMPGHGAGPRAVAANSLAVFAGFSNEVVVLDLRSGNLSFVPTGDVRSVVADAASGKGLVLDANNNLHIIEPSTMRVDVVAIGRPTFEVAYLPRVCSAYVSGPVVTEVSVPCAAAESGAINAQALWWWPSESGWGINVAHQGSKLFATWFTYDTQGQPAWLVMSDGTEVSRNAYAGTVYRTTGPSFDATTFDPARVVRTPVGSARVDVLDASNARITATVDGVTVVKSLTKQVFASPTPTCGQDVTPGALPNYQDLWWNAAESGWGLNIAHQGDILFITWFTYDTDGRALWFVGSDIRKTGNGTYSGTLYRTVGMPLMATPWDPARVTRTPVGTATLTFSDDNNATFAYTVGGVAGSKRIGRQVFAVPTTRCR
jgi:DNA-binding beta-propeller fold protein YncE